jgi:hypothetical protein
MNLKLIFFVVAFVLLPLTLVKAQGPAPPPPLNEVPLDGFSIFLLAVGASYGGYKLRKKRKS